MNSKEISRRRLLSGAAAAGAGLAIGALSGPGTGFAASPVAWQLNANGWSSALEFSKRLGNGDPRSLGGGWIANFRNYANGGLDPVLAFRQPSGDGVNFLRVIDSHYIQIYRQNPGSTTGYFYEYRQKFSSWSRTGPYPWNITGGQSASRPEDGIELDTTPKNDDPVGWSDHWMMHRTEGSLTTYPVLTEYHWFNEPTSVRRQMWGIFDGLAVVGVTHQNMTYKGERRFGDKIFHYYQKPFRWFRPLDTNFDKVEDWLGMDRYNQIKPAGYFGIDEEVAWRKGIGGVSSTQGVSNVTLGFTFDSNHPAGRPEWYYDPWDEQLSF
ncbi:twin-arginine translocation signal domain-containing protein [Micromonospora chersina]|uniref:twin-arginine translocation signal domain-containing protein n=1 Tax=Micromonospora chersina TaxID=47854 RepID=UPI00371481FA